MKWSTRLNLFGKTLLFVFRVTPDKTSFHYGMGNRCEDGRYVVFLDYDETPLEWIYQEIELLQVNDELGTAYLFKTKHGHHVVFLEKLYLEELLSVMQKTTIDPNYRLVPLLYANKVWVLRQSDKKDESIEYLGRVIGSSSLEKSRAHKKYMRMLYDIPERHFKGGFWDKTEKLILGYYRIAEK